MSDPKAPGKIPATAPATPPAKTPAETPTRTMGDLHAPAYRDRKDTWPQRTPDDRGHDANGHDAKGNEGDKGDENAGASVFNSMGTGDSLSGAGDSPAKVFTPSYVQQRLHPTDPLEFDLDDYARNPGRYADYVIKRPAQPPVNTVEDLKKQYRLEKKTGDPIELIKLDPELAQRKADRLTFADMRKHAPVIAKWMEKHPDNMVLGLADADNLREVEVATRYLTHEFLLTPAADPITILTDQNQPRALDKIKRNESSLPIEEMVELLKERSPKQSDDPNFWLITQMAKSPTMAVRLLTGFTNSPKNFVKTLDNLKWDVLDSYYRATNSPYDRWFGNPASRGYYNFVKTLAAAEMTAAAGTRLDVLKLRKNMEAMEAAKRLGPAGLKSYKVARRRLIGQLIGFLYIENSKETLKRRFHNNASAKFDVNQIPFIHRYKQIDRSPVLSHFALGRLGVSVDDIISGRVTYKKLLQRANLALDKSIKYFNKRQIILNSIAKNPRTIQLLSLETTKEVLEHLRKYPSSGFDLVTEQASNMLPTTFLAVAGTLFAGPIGGMLVSVISNGAIDYLSGTTSMMERRHIKQSDTQSVRRVMKDERALDEAHKIGTSRAIKGVLTGALGEGSAKLIKHGLRTIGKSRQARKIANKQQPDRIKTTARKPDRSARRHTLGPKTGTPFHHEIIAHAGGEVITGLVFEGTIDPVDLTAKIALSIPANAIPRFAQRLEQLPKNIRLGRAALSGQRKLQTIGEWEKGSVVRALAPEKYKEIVQRQSGKQPLYLDATRLNTLILADLSPAQRAKMLKNLKQTEKSLQDAIDTGRLVPLTVADYRLYIAPTKNGLKITEHASFIKHGITAAEARRRQRKFAEDYDHARAQDMADAATLPERQEDLFKKLRQTITDKGLTPNEDELRKLVQRAKDGPAGLNLDKDAKILLEQKYGITSGENSILRDPLTIADGPTPETAVAPHLIPPPPATDTTPKLLPPPATEPAPKLLPPPAAAAPAPSPKTAPKGSKDDGAKTAAAATPKAESTPKAAPEQPGVKVRVKSKQQGEGLKAPVAQDQTPADKAPADKAPAKTGKAASGEAPAPKTPATKKQPKGTSSGNPAITAPTGKTSAKVKKSGAKAGQQRGGR